MLFLKNWREFLEGGMKMTIFLKKGNHPIEQSRKTRAGRAGKGRKEGRVERMRAGPTEGRAAGTFEEINSKKKKAEAEQSRKWKAENW